MKRLALIALLSAIFADAVAQTGVVSVYPENEGTETLTMEDAVLGRRGRPSGVYASWVDAGNYAIRQGREWKNVNAESGEVSDYKPETLPEGLPASAANLTKGGEGLFAYTQGQSLWIFSGGENILVAESENEQITYGQSVSRNEFGITGGIFWSPEGAKLAFYRKDESKVTEFPLLDITTRTGSNVNIKYPMNGMESERISLGIYDLASGRTVWCAVDDFGEDRYLTNISWSPDSKYVFIQVVDRSQKHSRLNMYCSADGSFVRTILTEDDARYVEPQDPLYFVKGSYSFIYRTNCRDGYFSLYLCDTLGSVKRITQAAADVAYKANDGRYIYYTSAEVSPVESHLYRIELKRRGRLGEPQRLTPDEGWHNVELNEDCTMFLDNYSSFTVPQKSDLRTADGKLIRNIGTAEDPLKDFNTGKAMLGTVKSADGKYDNWYRLFLPPDFDETKKYPVILYVYGGPHSQMVTGSWLGQVRMWEMLMAQKGYIVYVQDNRGTQNQGEEYEKAIHKYCGQNEMADQMVGIEMLKSLPFVDAERIGVHGWSYGGFMTISLMTNYPETFKVGVAGGPVIDWKWYEVMYGERYMETEATNPEGFERTSLINKAGDLKGKLLICQGAIDNTVVWEHSLSFVQACIENNVQLDYFPYPRSEHNVMGRWRVHLMDKVTNYFDDYL